MDTRIVPGGSRTDVLTTDSAPRVTPSSGVPFRDMVARGAGALIRGAEAAVTSLPGAPIVAAAVRSGGAPLRPSPHPRAERSASADRTARQPSKARPRARPRRRPAVRQANRLGRRSARPKPGVQSLLPPAPRAAGGRKQGLQRHVERAQGTSRHRQERDRQHSLTRGLGRALRRPDKVLVSPSPAQECYRFEESP